MSNSKLYIGRAGEYYVMSELLAREWNVATPAVDVGNDIYVVKDGSGTIFYFMQVKTGQNKSSIPRTYVTNVKIRREQLYTATSAELIYALVLRDEMKWLPVLIVERSDLLNLYVSKKRNGKGVNIGMEIKLVEHNGNYSAKIANVDASKFIEDWPVVNAQSIKAANILDDFTVGVDEIENPEVTIN